MKSYSLRLIAEGKPNTPEEIIVSNNMISWGLWDAFSKLTHVSLSFFSDSPWSSAQAQQGAAANPNQLTIEDWQAQLVNEPITDFTLIHSYTRPGMIFREMNTIRCKTRHQIMGISENPNFGGADCWFTFLPFGGCDQIVLPAFRNVLDASMVGVTKSPGSILLDHEIPIDPNWGPFYDVWSSKLYDWLAPLAKDRVIGQLRREEWEPQGHKFPEWLKLIPASSYVEYLKSTAPFENYIMTHPGTYEHSIIDMVARGIRVISPVSDVRTFAPPDTVERLELDIIATKEDLLTLLENPLNEEWRADECTDGPGIAAQIDTHCQNVLQ